ncbi:hypothetical protein Taro_044271 [Colocasia esculenta]|uniref:Uncharacterized protein n=1 Tax=Colocasia esculenta TaxID=4460 RepID=A0A843X2D4_COLES|nr:hypothetical protein [Colocasia esculenta]
MVFKYPYSRALNASILSKTLWVCAFRCTCSPRPLSKTPGWETLPKRRFCPETYPYIHKKLCSYTYVSRENPT